MIFLKKALRSIWRGKRAFAASLLLIALGVASYVGFAGAGGHLEEAVLHFYGDQRFGEAFASVREISHVAARSLERMDGIAAVSPRTAVTARVLTEAGQQLTLRLLSWEPEEGGQNRPLLLAGRAPGRNEMVLSKNYLEAQGLSLGDTVALTAGGRQLRPVVVGVAISPEYIVEVGEGMTGDGAAAGYAYLLPAEVGTLAGAGGYYNQLSFLLEPGTAFADVELDLEEALAPWGLLELYGREDHPGHREAWMNVSSLASTGAMISAVFLGVAVLVLTILLRRVIEQERTQIGTLLAFGLRPRGLLLFYLLYGGAISLAGGLLGCLGGAGVARWAADLYYQLFFMPAAPMGISPSLPLLALAIALLAGIAGAALGTRSVLRLSPAESMHPPAPTVGGRRRARNRHLRLPPSLSMALRGIARGRGRSAFVAGGMALSFSILAFMAAYSTMMDDIMLDQFDHAQRYDMKVSLEQARHYQEAVESAAALPQVAQAEGVLELEATFYSGHLQEECLLTGLPRNGGMRRLYDSELRRELPHPEEGVVLSRSLADKLGAEVGDRVQFTTAWAGKERATVTVAALLAENTGSAAYLDLEALWDLMGVGSSVNGLLLHTGDPTGVIEALAEGENVVAVVDQADQRQVVQNMLDQTLGVNLLLFLVIGLGVAFAIIAATASISLSERSREYATMRVLGMEPLRIGRTLVLEYLILTGVGFLPGVPLTVGFKTLLIATMSTDTLYLSTGVSPSSFLVGAVVCLAAVLAANLSTVRHIGRLDMTAVLKERE